MGHQTTPGAGPSSCIAGGLTPAQMDLVIRNLPLQVSVMDETSTVVYWHGDLFEDCELRHCGVHVNESHNAHSQETIARMEAAFRDGGRDEAVFRRLEGDRLILVRYVPLRDAHGTYCGMMETMQDITDVAGLEGEKLDLDWE
jgi:DUF438 domain-containing protein